MTLPEVMIVVTMVGVVFGITVPKLAPSRDAAARRAARQQLVAAFAATRSVAVQKGKTATLTLTSTTATVEVLNGLAATPVTVWGPVGFDSPAAITMTPLDGAPTTLQYDARGLLSPTPVGTLRYRLTVGTVQDTVCVSPAGLILPPGCAL